MKNVHVSLQVARSLVGVAGGATRAALIQHQARRDNLADVSAKDASQETLVNLAALLSNLLIVPFLATNNLYVNTNTCTCTVYVRINTVCTNI